VKDEVSYPYRRMGKIVVLCILTFIFLESIQEDILDQMVTGIPKVESANFYLRIFYVY
jgi:hypothetical protein